MAKGLEKAMVLKEKFGPLLGQVSGMFGISGEESFDKIFDKLEQMQGQVEKVNAQMKNPVFNLII